MTTASALSVDEALHKPLDEMATTTSESADSNTTKPTASSSSNSSSHMNGTTSHSETSQEINDDDREDAAAGLEWPGGLDDHDGDGSGKAMKAVLEELKKVKEERNSFESQYRGLLSKLSQMRSTLGDRLRQDAEELDRREQQIDALQIKSDDLTATVETLKSELLSSHQDVERLTNEMDTLRAFEGPASWH